MTADAETGALLTGRRVGKVALDTDRLARLARFGLVGISGVAVNEGALAVLVDGVGVGLIAAAVIASQCSTVWNFALVERWAFESEASHRPMLHRFGMFWAVNMVALALRAPLLGFFTNVLGIHYLISNLISLAILMVARFLIADSWIWGTNKMASTDTDTDRAVTAAGAASLDDYDDHLERDDDRPPVILESRDRLAPLASIPAAVWVSAAVVTGAALRLWDLARLGFNSDEAVYAGQGASIAGNAIYLPNFPVFRAHPLLFQTFISLFSRTHIDDWTIRACSVAFGLGTIVAAYLAARTMFGRRVGVVTAFIVAVMPYLVVVNRQVLLDGPMTFFTTVALYLLAKFATTQRPVWLWAASGSLSLAFLSKETSIVMLGAVFTFAALAPGLVVKLRDIAIALVVYGVGILPYPFSLAFADRGSSGDQFLAWQLFRRSNHTPGFYVSHLPSALGYLVVVAAIAGVVLMRRRERVALTLLLSWILVPFAFFQLWPVKGWQYLLPIAIPVAILAAYAVVRSHAILRSRGAIWQYAAPAFTVVMMISLVVPTWSRITPSTSGVFLAGSGGVPGGRETGEWIADHLPEGATILAMGPSMANIVMFYGHRKTYGLSVSPNPLHRNPVYEPVNNPDRQIRTNELQYVIWDSFTASRTKHFSDQLLRYVDRYHGRAIHTETVDVSSVGGGTVKKPVIIVYEVRP